MFKLVELKNYRTHKHSTLELNDLTLIIGSNNTGKSNFLKGLHFISRLLSKYNPKKESIDENSFYFSEIYSRDYHTNKHSLCNESEPIEFRCLWIDDDSINKTEIEYTLSIYPDTKNSDIIFGKELLNINYNSKIEIFKHGFSEKSNKLLLRKLISESQSPFKEKIDYFFHSLSTIFFYNFQPSFLKGEAFSSKYIDGRHSPVMKKNYLRNYRENNIHPYTPRELGMEGGNFQELLHYIKEVDQETYNRFMGYLKRFVKNFNGLIFKEDGLKWQFDMGASHFPYFNPEKISDGILKAGVIALLCSIMRPPSLIMIEEIENGINQKKFNEFFSWLIHTSDNGKRTQFIFTSHSPSVIREFSNKPHCVYNFHLRDKDFVTLLTNLNDAIIPLLNMGTVEGDEITLPDGKKIIALKPYHLVELFYNGVLGEL